MKNLTLLVIFFLFWSPIKAQIDAQSLMSLPTVADNTEMLTISGANSGAILYNISEEEIFMFNGSNWVKILSDNSKDVVDNELFFEDTNYYYVSVRMNTTDWMVSRYSKTDLNIEDVSMGSGSQPADLTTVTGLTY